MFTPRTQLTEAELETVGRHRLDPVLALRAINLRDARRAGTDEGHSATALVMMTERFGRREPAPALTEPPATIELTESERACVARYRLDPATATRAAAMLRAAKGSRASDEARALAMPSFPLHTR